MSSLLASTFILASGPKSPPYLTCARTPVILLRAAAVSAALVPAVADTEDIVLESLEEHHIVKWLLSELVDMDPAHERFDAKVTVLIENVRHHVAEEESEFFPKVREQLGRNELADLGATLADVAKTLCFLTDMDTFATFNEAYIEGFGDSRPAKGGRVAVGEC